MRRRAFIAFLGGAVAPPLLARAQQKPTPLVGVLRMAPAALDPFLAPFRGFMAGLGWEEGRSVAFRVLHADGEDARMPELARVLALSEARVLVTTGTVSLRALKDATAVIPIVGVGEDFVGAGFARSMARPGGNVTGISILATELDAKRLEGLRAALPAAGRGGAISGPGNPPSSGRGQGVEQTARRVGVPPGG